MLRFCSWACRLFSILPEAGGDRLGSQELALRELVVIPYELPMKLDVL